MNDRRIVDLPCDPVNAALERRIRVPGLLRVALALVVLLGRIAFSAVGLVLSFQTFAPHVPHSAGALALALGMTVGGGTFLRIGWCVLRRDDRSGPVLGPGLRRVFGILFGACALVMMAQAWEADSVGLAAKAIFVAFLAFLFVRSTVRR